MIGLLQNFLNADDIDLINDKSKIIPAKTESPKRTNSKKERIIILYKGDKYDITDFIKKHPGGKGILKENNGKEIEQQMLGTGHSDNAYSILDKYKI